MDKRDSRERVGLAAMVVVACLSAMVSYSLVMLVAREFNIPPRWPLYEVGLGMMAIAAMFVLWRRLMYVFHCIEQDTGDYESRMRALDAHSMVSITDADARLIDVNDRFLSTFEYTREELLGNEPSMLYPQHQMPKFEAIRAALAEGRSWTGEVCLLTKSGKEVWTHSTIIPNFDRNGNHVSSVSVRSDITEIKKAQRERDMRETLHLLHDEVYVFDAETLHFTYLNQAAMDRFGWDEAKYVTKTVRDALPEFDSGAFRTRTRALVAGKKSMFRETVELFDHPHELNVQYKLNKEGRGQFIAICRDVTAQHEYQKRKDAFVSTVSHELRSPLTSVTGGLDLVLSGAAGELHPKSRSLIEIAQRNARRLILIINDILDLEKISAGQMEFNFRPTDMSALIKDAAAANEVYCRQHGVEARLFGVNDTAMAECDPDRMFQVFTNLISNAAKFSEAGTAIDIMLKQSGPETTITVRDYGMGIPADALPTIFERFTQVSGHDRKEKGGTGLGLNIVKAIVKQHGGSVTCDSTEGKGTTFTVRIPTERDTDTVPKREPWLEAAE